MKSKHIGFVAEPEMQQELRAVARSEYRSVSNLIYHIVKQFLKKHSSEQKKKARDL